MWCMLILSYSLKSECLQSAHVGKAETSGSFTLRKVVCLDSITLLNVVYANILYYTLKSECFQSAHVGESETSGTLGFENKKLFFLSSREPDVVCLDSITLLNVVYANIILYSEV